MFIEWKEVIWETSAGHVSQSWIVILIDGLCGFGVLSNVWRFERSEAWMGAEGSYIVLQKLPVCYFPRNHSSVTLLKRSGLISR